MSKKRVDQSSETDTQKEVAGRPLSHYLLATSNTTEAAASRLSAHSAAIKALLDRLEKLVVPEHLSTVTSLVKEMEAFRTHAALVGQVKAGKTMLTNSIAGLPGMLPSDVNPWTSVVTSIHINTPKPRGCNAIFTFYTAEEWANLTESGGRLGELARRADFESEISEMRLQIAQMQMRTEQRLGANFGLLLGQQHKFSGFSSKLLERYVCLGETPAPGDTSGRYADVTRSADLFVDEPSYGLPITISDTPGVNDPFLARERATLDTLAHSDICVVVLSAHQSFSTVDLALLRILMSLQSEQIVLFVNRIDELENPDEQIREIDGFIRGILREKGINANLPIVYGSAAWAEIALQGLTDAASPTILTKLEKLATARVQRAEKTPSEGRLLLGQPPYSIEKTRDLSGLHELKMLLSHKAIMNVAAPVSGEVLVRAMDIANQSALLMAQVLESDMPLKPDLDMSAVVDRLDNILRELDDRFLQAWQMISDQMLMKMSYAYREFIDRESATLKSLVEEGGRIANWSPDAEALRKELNAAYHAFVAEGNSDVSDIFSDAASAISAVYADILQNHSQLFAVRAPRVVDPKAPASLMRTMTIDMKTTWIGNWLAKTTGGGTLVKRFSETVTAEMVEFLDEMRDVHVLDYVNQARRTLHDFLADHLQTLQNLAILDGHQRGGELRQKLGIEIEVKQRLVSLKGLLSELQAQIDALCSDFRLKLQ
jgi:Dynamin family